MILYIYIYIYIYIYSAGVWTDSQTDRYDEAFVYERA